MMAFPNNSLMISKDFQSFGLLDRVKVMMLLVVCRCVVVVDELFRALKAGVGKEKKKVANACQSCRCKGKKRTVGGERT